MYGSALYNKELFCEFDFESGFYGEPEAHVICIGASSLAVPGVEAPSNTPGALLAGALSETPYLNVSFADADPGPAAVLGISLCETTVPGVEAPSTTSGLLLKGPLLGAMLMPYPPRYMYAETFVTGNPTPVLYESALYDENILENPYTTYKVQTYNTGMAITTCLIGGSIQQDPGGFVFAGDMIGSFATAHNMRSAAITVMEMDSVDIVIADVQGLEPGFFWTGDIAKTLHKAQEMPLIPQLIRGATELAGLINPHLDTMTLVPMSFMGTELRVLTFPDGPVVVPARVATEHNGVLYRDTNRSDTIIYGSRYNYISRGAQYLGLSGWDELYIDGNKVAGVLPGLSMATLTCGGSHIGDIYVDYLFALHNTVTAQFFRSPEYVADAHSCLDAVTYCGALYAGFVYLQNTATKTSAAFYNFIDAKFTLLHSVCELSGVIVGDFLVHDVAHCVPVVFSDVCYDTEKLHCAQLYVENSCYGIEGIAYFCLHATVEHPLAPATFCAIANNDAIRVIESFATCGTSVTLNGAHQLSVACAKNSQQDTLYYECDANKLSVLTSCIYDAEPSLLLLAITMNCAHTYNACMLPYYATTQQINVYDAISGRVYAEVQNSAHGHIACIRAFENISSYFDSCETYASVTLCKDTLRYDCTASIYLQGDISSVYSSYVSAQRCTFTELYCARIHNVSVGVLSWFAPCISSADALHCVHANSSNSVYSALAETHTLPDVILAEYALYAEIQQPGHFTRCVAVYSGYAVCEQSNAAYTLGTAVCDFLCENSAYIVYADELNYVNAETSYITITIDDAQACCLYVATAELLCGATSVDCTGYEICTTRTVHAYLEYRSTVASVILAYHAINNSACAFTTDIADTYATINLTPTPYWYDFVIEYDFAETDPAEMAFIF